MVGPGPVADLTDNCRGINRPLFCSRQKGGKKGTEAIVFGTGFASRKNSRSETCAIWKIVSSCANDRHFFLFENQINTRQEAGNPKLLKEIIAELGQQLQPIAADKRLKDIRQTITLVDGTLLSALPQMMQASLLKQQTGSGMMKWRLHTHFEVARGWPVRMDLTPNGGGEHDERAVMAKTFEADRLYAMDRGYAKFTLFNQIVGAWSSYVCRLRDNSKWEVQEVGARHETTEVGGIISDEVVTFPNSKVESQPDHPVRVICVRCNPHTTRGKYKGGSSGVDSDGVLRIATNLMDYFIGMATEAELMRHIEKLKPQTT